jgi:RNA polymerase sigma factor (sigma-70 family)
VVNEFLRTRRLRSSTEIVLDTVDDRGSVEFESAVVDRDQVWLALGHLTPRQRAVVVLRYYEDLPDSEIARLVGCREATVRSLAARALQLLRTSELAEGLP